MDATAELEHVVKPVTVTTPGGKQVVVKTHSLLVSSPELDVVVVDPRNPKAVAMEAGDIIKVVGEVVKLANTLLGALGGGGGGGGSKCKSTISQTAGPNGTITTTVTTECSPA